MDHLLNMEEFFVAMFTTSDIADFSIQLNRFLHFSANDSWSVAVTEISLTTSLYNAQDDFIKIRNKKKRYYRVNIPDGLYPQFEHLRETILSARPKFKKHFTGSGLRVRPGRSVHFSKNLSKVLELPQKINNVSPEHTLIFTPNIQILTKYISILCNFVEDRMVGEDTLPLLTSVVLDRHSLGSATTIEPYPLEYVAVKPGVYKDLRFKLQSTDQVPMKFRDNFIMIKLKFVRL